MNWKTIIRNILEKIEASYDEIDDNHIVVNRVGENGRPVECIIGKPTKLGELNIVEIFAVAACYEDLSAVPPQVATDVLWQNNEVVPLGHWGLRGDADGIFLSYAIKLLWEEDETPPGENLIQMAMTGCTMFVSRFKEDLE